MKRISVLFFCFLILTAGARAQNTRWSLQQCIDSALARNLLIKQRGLQIETASVSAGQAKANLLPGVSAGVDHGIQQGRSIDPFTNAYVNQRVNYAGYFAGSDLVLFNGLSLRNSVRQTGYATQAARMDQQQERDNVTLNVILAYLQVLNNEDLAAVSKAQVAVSKLQVERLEKLNREGAISPPILYDLQGQLKGEEVNVVNALNAVETAKLTLLQLMNLPYDSAMMLTRDGTEGIPVRYALTSEAVYQNALDRLALVKASSLRRKSAEAAVKVAKGQLYPTLLLSGNINSNYSSVARRENQIGSSEMATDAYVLVNGGKTPVMAPRNNYAQEKIGYTDQVKNNVATNIGVGLRVPILNALQTRNQIKLARINVKTAEVVEETTRLQLRQAIEQAHLAMNNSWQRYKVLQEQVAAYAESFRAAEVRFNAGVGTLVTYSVDYLLAKNRLDQANLNLVVARYDYVLRTKVLDFYNGVQ
jgi:outer membrane protein